MNKLLGVFCLVVGMISTGSAYAGNLWGATAAGCVVGDPAIQGNRYTVVAGSVGNNGTNVATITLYCPVETLGGGNATALKLTYRDSSGTTTSAQTNGGTVAAQLWRMAHSDGSITSISNASYSSDSSGTTSATEGTGTFTHTFDFSLYTYYVRVDISRNNTTPTTTFYGVSLSN